MAIDDRATAEAWLNRVAEHIDKDAVRERTILAQNLATLGMRSQTPALLKQARQITSELTKRSDADQWVWYQYAQLAEQAGELEVAEKGYRKALELDPELQGARNNLAMVLDQERPAGCGRSAATSQTSDGGVTK